MSIHSISACYYKLQHPPCSLHKSSISSSKSTNNRLFNPQNTERRSIDLKYKSVMSRLAFNILNTIASPAFKTAYEKEASSRKARKELGKLSKIVELIMCVLIEGEKRQVSFDFVMEEWIKMLKDVLYDAEDMFDEFIAENLVKRQMMEGKEKVSLMEKVHVSCFKLNPTYSGNSIDKKVKAIRMKLVNISTTDIEIFEPLTVRSESITGRREDPGYFVNLKDVIGRENDKKTILKMLIDKTDYSEFDNTIVLAIVGIGVWEKQPLLN